MDDDIPVWSPEDHLDRVYERGHSLRRRRTRLLQAAPVAVLAAVLVVVALVATGGSEPDAQRRLRVAGAPDQTTTTASTIDGIVGTGTVGTGSVLPDSSVPPGEKPRPTTTALRSTVPPTTVRATTTTVASGGSGVSGTVMFGPQCPVERPDQPCPDKPGPADVELQRTNGQVVGTAHAGADGRFAIAAPPGQYTVVATSGSSMGGCQPTDATVSSGHYTDVTVSCDTGIR